MLAGTRTTLGIYCVWTAVSTFGVADYQETLTSYGKKKIVSIVYPSLFLKNQPAEIEIRKQENNIFQKILLHSSFTEGFKEELHHFSDIFRAIKEMSRVLCNDGRSLLLISGFCS